MMQRIRTQCEFDSSLCDLLRFPTIGTSLKSLRVIKLYSSSLPWATTSRKCSASMGCIGTSKFLLAKSRSEASDEGQTLRVLDLPTNFTDIDLNNVHSHIFMLNDNGKFCTYEYREANRTYISKSCKELHITTDMPFI